MGLGCPWRDPVCATSDIKLIMICNIVNDTEHLFGDIQVLFLAWILFSLLAMASSASAASAGSSMILKYISQVRAELRRQRPEAREAWLKAEMDTMQLGSSHEGKPSVRDVCKHLNMAVSQKKGKLNRKTLVENLVEKLMSEIGHVTESASASSGSSVVKRYVQVLRVELTQKEPEERRSWLLKELDALLKKERKYGKPSVEDVCRFLTLPIGDTAGGLSGGVMKSNIMDKLLGDLPDSSAAASAPVIGFVVALSIF